MKKPMESSVRKPAKSRFTLLLLQVLELQHAVLLHYENTDPDGDISALNNEVRALLDQAWTGSGFLSERDGNGEV